MLRFARRALKCAGRGFRIALAIALIALLSIIQPLQAALPFYAVWEVRTTGSDTNGGFFDPGTHNGGSGGTGCTGGTDFSQQNAAHVAFNGSTITATTAGASATITITGYTVATTDVCNSLQITGGTNFTTGWYSISSVNVGASTWTLDRNVATGVGAAMTGNMGGALATPKQLVAAIVSGASSSVGMYAYLKAGTYTQTTATPFTGTVQNFIIEGYQTTRGDLGTKPLITTATNATKLFTMGSSTTIYGVKFINVSFSNTAGSRDVGIYASTGGGSDHVQFDSCLFDGFSNAILGGFDGSGDFYFFSITLYGTEIKNSTGAGVQSASNLYVIGSYLHGNTGAGVQMSGAPGIIASLQMQDSVIASNGNSGARLTVAGGGGAGFTYSIKNSDFYANTGDGVVISTSQSHPGVLLSGNVFEANTSFGIESLDANGYGDLAWYFSKQNAFFNNTSGARNKFPTDTTDITLTGSPFVNAAGGNFALNSTAGAGALLKAAGFPGTIPNAGTGFLDVGALQTQGSSVTQSGQAFTQ